MPEFLSFNLFREVRSPAFFRVLSGRNGRIYVDVLDVLERECADRPEGLGREEALAIVEECLSHQPDWTHEEEEDGADKAPAENVSPLSGREKARQVLDHLTQSRWLEEPPRRDWKRRVFLDAHGATMVAALRKVAYPDAAVFTDKLLAVCVALANEDQLTQTPWQTVEWCLDNVRQGLNELRAMQKSVQRFTSRQLEENTLKGNLQVVFDDYSSNVAQSCYAALVKARLPTRLPDATRRIYDRLFADPVAMATMQTAYLSRHEGMSAEQARAGVVRSLDELAGLLDRVLPMADEIDRRTADFTRRSLSRFRYLQEVTGERREQAREFFERLNLALSGRRLSDEEPLPELPAFRLPESRLPNGRDSLKMPYARRASLEQQALDDDLSEADRDAGLADIERALRESLSVRRANEFVLSLPGGKGTRISSEQLAYPESDPSSSLLALLLHAGSTSAVYRVEPGRSDDALHMPEMDDFPGGKVERFYLTKK